MIKKFITYFILFIFVLDANANSIFVNIKNNNFDKVKEQIALDPKVVNKLDENSCSPLMLSVLTKNKQITKLLLDSDANMNAQTESMCMKYIKDKASNNTVSAFLRYSGNKTFNALTLAILIKDKEIVKILLKHSQLDASILKEFDDVVFYVVDYKFVRDLIRMLSDIKAENKDKKFPMHKAAREQNVELLKSLIKNGSDINAVDEYNQTPLYVAIAYGSNDDEKAVDIIKTLVDNGADINIKSIYGLRPLDEMKNRGMTNVEEMLSNHPKTSKILKEYTYTGDKNLFFQAIKNGNYEKVKKLIEYFPQILNEKHYFYDCIPLFSATYYQQTEIVKLLLENGALNETKRSLCFYNLSKHKTKEWKSFYDKLHKHHIYNERVEDYMDAFSYSVLYNNNEIFHELLKYNPTNEQKFMALEIAMHMKSDKRNILLDSIDDFNATDEYGNTLLHKAAKLQNPTVVKYLLDKGMPVDSLDKDKDTPLMDAVTYDYNFEDYAKQTQVVKLLLDYGANVQHKNKYNETPLKLASQGKNKEVLKIILDHKPDMSIISDDGKSVYGSARDKQTAEMIKKYGYSTSEADTNFNYFLILSTLSILLLIITKRKMRLNTDELLNNATFDFLKAQQQAEQIRKMLMMLFMLVTILSVYITGIVLDYIFNDSLLTIYGAIIIIGGGILPGVILGTVFKLHPAIAVGVGTLAFVPTAVYMYVYVLLDLNIDFATKEFILTTFIYQVSLVLLFYVFLKMDKGFKGFKEKGSSYIASDILKAQFVDANNSTLSQKRVLNIVEEMAIASQLPVPKLYLLKDDGINALTTGLDQEDMAIIITQGAIDYLSRDELQALIAYQFGHIVTNNVIIHTSMDLLINGLNALYGIKHEESSDDKKEDNTAVVAAVPFAPLVIVILNTIGIINNIFSRLIQASFSIESIRAADAIAVRFTRNIDGLKGALLQGVVQKNKTKITSVDASDYEHSLFSSCSKESDLYGFILKTHPNIKTRIKTLDSKWDGSLPKARKSSTEEKVSIKESENDKKTS